jgi:hypothetical protein
MPAVMVGAGKMASTKMPTTMSPTMEMGVTSAVVSTMATTVPPVSTTAMSPASRIRRTKQTGRQRSNGN